VGEFSGELESADYSSSTVADYRQPAAAQSSGYLPASYSGGTTSGYSHSVAGQPSVNSGPAVGQAFGQLRQNYYASTPTQSFYQTTVDQSTSLKRPNYPILRTKDLGFVCEPFNQSEKKFSVLRTR
jgi:hypothetical protein